MGTWLSAGAAVEVITPAPGRAMAGYARRVGPAEGTLDDLHARVLVLDDGAVRLAIVALELLFAPVPLVARIRDLIAAATGIPAVAVLVNAVHTHCGPGGLARPDEPLLDEIAVKTADGVARAASRIVPVRATLGETRLTSVSQNRRDPAGPKEERLRVLALFEGDSDTAVATLISFACHATVLEHDTQRWSADWPGAACRVVEQAIGGTALYLQGCAGDVNPVYTSHTASGVARVGGIVGSAAARVALELAALPDRARTINLSWDEELHVAPPTVGRLVGRAPLAATSVSVSATRRTRPTPEALDTAERELEAALARAPSVAERRALLPKRNEIWIERLQSDGDAIFDTFDVPEAERAQLEVQGFRLGEGLYVATLPGEPFTELGWAVEQRIGADVIVAGYANGSAGYLPTRAGFDAGGYEAGCSMYSRGTGEALAAAASDAIPVTERN